MLRKTLVERPPLKRRILLGLILLLSFSHQQILSWDRLGPSPYSGQFDWLGCEPLASVRRVASLGTSVQVKRQSNNKPLECCFWNSNIPSHRVSEDFPCFLRLCDTTLNNTGRLGHVGPEIADGICKCLLRNPTEENRGIRVVLDMTEGLNGHNLPCDHCRGWETLRQKQVN